MQVLVAPAGGFKASTHGPGGPCAAALCVDYVRTVLLLKLVEIMLVIVLVAFMLLILMVTMLILLVMVLSPNCEILLILR